MNKKNVFLGASALVLSFAAIFATKASAKFAGTAAYVRTFGGQCLQVSASGIFTTTTGTNKAKILTVGGSQRTLYSNALCSTANVYFK
jgi:hypothetical protein